MGVGTRGRGTEEFQIPDASEGVRYRPEDGALIVLYGDDELRVELPGWTLEEVTSIVNSIRNDDWSAFHEVMALGGVQGVSVQGSSMGFSYGQSSQKEGQLGSPNSDLRSRKSVQEGSLQALGEDLDHLPYDSAWNFSLWVAWMVWSFFACLGVCVTGCWVFGGISTFAVDQVFGYGIVLVWVLSVLHRVWIVVVSPVHVGTQRYWRQFCTRRRSRLTREEVCWILWVLLAILLGWASPAEASPWMVELDTPEAIIEHQALVTADKSGWERQIQCSAGVPEVKLGAEMGKYRCGFCKDVGCSCLLGDLQEMRVP